MRSVKTTGAYKLMCMRRRNGTVSYRQRYKKKYTILGKEREKVCLSGTWEYLSHEMMI